VVEESDRSDTLDEGGVKKMTGSEIITARPLYKDFITFTATVLVSAKCFCHLLDSLLAEVLSLLLDGTRLCLLFQRCQIKRGNCAKCLTVSPSFCNSSLHQVRKFSGQPPRFFTC
jgi:hypothetical protein